ncbi:MAG: hypothetical protein EOO28_24275 [Comamonadaceae bacterium]|nr:MAG: hypothetical protein EOO28_24275 [Comamonadaceae bacterium]
MIQPLRTDYAVLEHYKRRTKRHVLLNFAFGALVCGVLVTANDYFFNHHLASRSTLVMVFTVLLLWGALLAPLARRYGVRLRRLVFDESYVNESAFAAIWTAGSLREYDSRMDAALKYQWLHTALAAMLGYFSIALMVLVLHFATGV